MTPPSAAEIRNALHRMLGGPSPVTALFCGNNRITAIALRELWTAGAELAVVGFDDFELADLLGITVVAQSTAEMGRIAAELLFQRLGGYRGEAKRLMIGTRLIVRGSAEIPPQR
jgi:LacI family transcriptional regulator